MSTTSMHRGGGNLIDSIRGQLAQRGRVDEESKAPLAEPLSDLLAGLDPHESERALRAALAMYEAGLSDGKAIARSDLLGDIELEDAAE